jgi:hypothetical protein
MNILTLKWHSQIVNIERYRIKKIRQYEQPHNINSSPNIIQENMSRNDDMGWICSKNGRNEGYAGKSEGNRPLLRLRNIWENNSKMDLRKKMM